MTERPKSWDAVYRHLQQQIIAGQLHPRQRLVEDEVIDQTGATRHAVRRAFDELERNGLVVRAPNKGVHVRDYSLAEIEELYEIRECLEMRAALGFDRPAPSEVVAELRALAEQHRDASRSQEFAEVFALNNRFHERIYAAAGNRLLAEAIQHYTFTTHPIRTRAFVSSELRDVAIEDHFAMVDAIEKGEGARLAELVRIHIRRPKDFYLAATLPGRSLVV